MKLATYSPEDVTILVAGIIPIEGLAADSFLTISKNMSHFTAQRTSDGQVARLYNNDQTYTISITLHSAAESNDVLTKISLLDQTLLKGKFPLFTNANATAMPVFGAGGTWITAPLFHVAPCPVFLAVGFTVSEASFRSHFFSQATT